MDDTIKLLLIRIEETECVDGRTLRDYVLESLERGVLVLTKETELEVIDIPRRLGDVEVVQTPEFVKAVQNNSTEAAKLLKKATDQAEEKRDILRRLTEYRKAHGLGCLKEVASKTRSKGKITDNTLRMLLTGDQTFLPIEDWRRIGHALELLEKKEEVGKDLTQTANEKAVRRAAFDLYGRSMVDTIQRVEPGSWQITLTDGGVSWATIQDDGSVQIEAE